MNRAAKRLITGRKESLICEHGNFKKTDGHGNPECPHGCGFPLHGLLITHAELRAAERTSNAS
jgi:hypothetical protein